MKKFYHFFLTMLLSMTASLPLAAQEAEVVELDVVDPDVSDKEVWNIYENEDYKVYFDIIKNLPLDYSRTYTLEDLDPKYSYIYNKNEIVVNQFGTKNWRKYTFTSAIVKIGENNVLDALVEAKAEDGEEVLRLKFVYNNPKVIDVKLAGKCEYIPEMNIYAISAMNKGSEMKEDYSIRLGIKGDSYSKMQYSLADLTANGNKIKVAAGDDLNITAADLSLSSVGEVITISGNVVAGGKTYYIEITISSEKEEDDPVEVNLMDNLTITADEGDIKFKAQTEEHEFVGFITCNTTDVPTGTYDLLSYSKYGDYVAEFNMYMSDSFENGKLQVANNEGIISIIATFTQNGTPYTVTATTSSATGIAVAPAQVAQSAVLYNLAGQFVNKAHKGVVIKNGKKVIVK